MHSLMGLGFGFWAPKGIQVLEEKEIDKSRFANISTNAIGPPTRQGIEIII